jgi:hypothetical protein
VIAAAGSCLGTAIKYLLNQNSGAGNNWAKGQNILAALEIL